MRLLQLDSPSETSFLEGLAGVNKKNFIGILNPDPFSRSKFERRTKKENLKCTRTGKLANGHWQTDVFNIIWNKNTFFFYCPFKRVLFSFVFVSWEPSGRRWMRAFHPGAFTMVPLKNSSLYFNLTFSVIIYRFFFPSRRDRLFTLLLQCIQILFLFFC